MQNLFWASQIFQSLKEDISELKILRSTEKDPVENINSFKFINLKWLMQF